MSDSNGNGGPWWSKLITRIGLPSAFVVYISVCYGEPAFQQYLKTYDALADALPEQRKLIQEVLDDKQTQLEFRDFMSRESIRSAEQHASMIKQLDKIAEKLDGP